MEHDSNKNNTDNADKVEEVVSMTENISRVRLTLEEIIANDNDNSRQQYLSSPPASSSKSPERDDASTVSSTFASETGSFISTSSSSVRSGFDGMSFRIFNDPFKGVNDDEFSNLDRYGFLSDKKLTIISEKEFVEKERKRL